MNKTEVIESIRQVASTVLPQGSKLYLYGSRARGDAHEDSDWDLLLLLDKPQKESTDFDKYAYPIMARGFDMWQYFSVHTYTKDEWETNSITPFYDNVQRESIKLIE